MKKENPGKKEGIVLFQLVPESWANINSRCFESDVATLKGVECMFVNILRMVLPLAGLAVGVMLVVGGFQLITAGGNQEGIQKAKNTFTYAIGGLVAVILVWFGLVFIENFTGFKVTEFNMP